jgi:HSP20 family protein
MVISGKQPLNSSDWSIEMAYPNEQQIFSPVGWFENNEHLHANLKPSTNKLTLRSHAWRPPTDMYELEYDVVVRVEIAGMDEDDFTIAIQDQQLIIRGSRIDIPEKRAYHQMEIRYGEFSTEVALPVQVHVEDAVAEYRKGFLTIVLPKIQPKQIQITDL